MTQGEWLSREFDSLEAHIALTLASPTLPTKQRLELERRFEAIRLKVGVERSQLS